MAHLWSCRKEPSRPQTENPAQMGHQEHPCLRAEFAQTIATPYQPKPPTRPGKCMCSHIIILLLLLVRKVSFVICWLSVCFSLFYTMHTIEFFLYSSLDEYLFLGFDVYTFNLESDVSYLDPEKNFSESYQY